MAGSFLGNGTRIGGITKLPKTVKSNTIGRWLRCFNDVLRAFAPCDHARVCGAGLNSPPLLVLLALLLPLLRALLRRLAMARANLRLRQADARVQHAGLAHA